MAPAALLLLCLGLCLNTRIQAMYFSGPKPEMRMRPSNVRPVGSDVVISCYTPYKAHAFRLLIVYYEQWASIDREYTVPEPGHEILLYHPNLRTEHASRYHCMYRSGLMWSLISNFLDLIITDLYPAPTMMAHPLVVKAGGSVDFFCRTSIPVNNWMLVRGVVELKNLLVETFRQDLNYTIWDLKEKDSGEYRCFYYNYSRNHMWSASSNAVSVYVEDMADTSIGGPAGFNATGPTDLAPRHAPAISLSSIVLTVLPLHSPWPWP